MKEKNSKLNDPAYFDSLNQKMMDYADEHPHTMKRTLSALRKMVICRSGYSSWDYIYPISE